MLALFAFRPTPYYVNRSMNARVHCVVTGLVQGVGYRYFIQTKARALALRGSVSNRPNGDVEIVAEGSKEVLEQLISLARTGPRSAMVTGISIDWEEPTGKFSGFDVQ